MIRPARKSREIINSPCTGTLAGYALSKNMPVLSKRFSPFIHHLCNASEEQHFIGGRPMSQCGSDSTRPYQAESAVGLRLESPRSFWNAAGHLSGGALQ